MKITKTSDIAGIVNKIAPPFLAEDWDNPGLQVGDPAAAVSRIMVALDPTPATIDAAVAADCQLLVTHHPLIFKPQKTVSTATPLGRSIHAAIRGGLGVIAMHTNYDCAPGGLNDVLAARLALTDLKPLQVTARQELVKLVVFVPDDYLERVRTALLPRAESLGAYRDCSFSAAGEGTFTPLDGAQPFVGSPGHLERVAERRLEVLLDRAALPAAIKALLASHPYEEPAFDIYPLLNQGRQEGLGRIGRIAPVALGDFAAEVGRRLSCQRLRYVGDPALTVSKVAVCSGSGSSLIHAASRAGAQVLVTGDVKYHEAREAEDLGIGLVDAGHFNTEIIMVDAVAAALERELGASGFDGCAVVPCSIENDPFRYPYE